MKNLNLDGLIEEAFDYARLGAFYRVHLRFQKYVKYSVLAFLTYLFGLPLMALLIFAGVHWALANLLSYTILHTVKFLGSDVWVWRR